VFNANGVSGALGRVGSNVDGNEGDVVEMECR
jgi:hypothetical protein